MYGSSAAAAPPITRRTDARAFAVVMHAGGGAAAIAKRSGEPACSRVNRALMASVRVCAIADTYTDVFPCRMPRTSQKAHPPTCAGACLLPVGCGIPRVSSRSHVILSHIRRAVPRWASYTMNPAPPSMNGCKCLSTYVTRLEYEVIYTRMYPHTHPCTRSTRTWWAPSQGRQPIT